MAPASPPNLTPTQQAAAALLAEGLPIKEVAKRLGIRTNDVLMWRTYHPAFRKLALRGALPAQSAESSTSIEDVGATPLHELPENRGVDGHSIPTAAPTPHPEPLVTTRMASFS